MKRILFFLLTLTAAMSVYAYDFMVDGLCYNIQSNGTVAVTFQSDTSPSYSNLAGDIDIPSQVTTYSGSTYVVDAINPCAFRGCSGISSVTIPSTITRLGGNAFAGCNGLISVKWNSITCDNDFTAESAPFKNLSGIKYFIFGPEVRKIPSMLCYGLSGLTGNLTIPNSVTKIGYAAFQNCSGLNTVVIPNTVNTIPPYTFFNCTALTSVSIPSSVTTVGKLAFGSCSSLVSVMWNAQSVSFVYNGHGPENNELPFNGCSRLQSITFGNSVASIPDRLCRYISSLSSVSISNSVTSIGDYAFANCRGLTSVTIPNSVTEIGSSAFYSCTGLNSVAIGNRVTTIGLSAFSYCSSIDTLFLDNNKYANVSTFSASKTNIKTLIFGNSVTSIGDSSFEGCSGLNTVTIPNSVTYIGASAFSGCTSLSKVNISNIASWSNISFANKTANPLSYAHHLYIDSSEITTLDVPNTVSQIKAYSFCGCTGMISLSIPNVTTSIGSHAFEDCSGLTTVTIPKSVASISSYAFRNCTGLTTCFSLNSNPPSIGQNTFPSNITVVVPESAVSTYQSNQTWNSYAIVPNSGLTYPNEMPTATYSGSGSGTENDPYLIFNPNQLDEVRNFLNYTGVWFKLMSDIDLAAWINNNNPTQGWMPIGNATEAFRGHFLGNNHTINNVRINRSATNYVGFFGVPHSAEIRDLTVNATTITGKDYTGCLVGSAILTTIDNCAISTPINGNQYVGGLVGNSNQSTITNCVVTSNVTASSDYSGGAVGVYSNLNISNVSSSGTVVGTNYVGGLIGGDELFSDSLSIEDCSHLGSVLGQESVGGILGYSYSAGMITISGCTQSGAVTGDSNVGGTVGCLSFGTKLDIINSKSTGNVICSGINVGGLVGLSKNTLLTINGCHSQGDVFGDSLVGGIVGQQVGKTTISSSNSIGNVTATGNYCGGLIGNGAFNSTSSVSSSYAIGDVSGESHIGGLIGYSSNTAISISDCYYNGTVTGTANNVGGLAGSGMYNLSMSYCNASVVGDNNVGGIAGNSQPRRHIHIKRRQNLRHSGFGRDNRCQRHVERQQGPRLGNPLHWRPHPGDARQWPERHECRTWLAEVAFRLHRHRLGLLEMGVARNREFPLQSRPVSAAGNHHPDIGQHINKRQQRERHRHR